jgi:drug/metabolite transporter (DMT)-like permease
MGLTYVFNYGGLALSSGTAAALIMASEPVWIAALASFS